MNDEPDYWAKRAFDRLDERHERQLDAAIQSGKQALNAALLLNGGACIALLGFLASAYAANTLPFERADLIAAFVGSLSSFAWGAFWAVLASGLGYLGNYSYSEAVFRKNKELERPYIRETAASKAWSRAGAVSLILAVLGVFASLSYFLCGLWSIRGALE